MNCLEEDKRNNERMKNEKRKYSKQTKNKLKEQRDSSTVLTREASRSMKNKRKKRNNMVSVEEEE